MKARRRLLGLLAPLWLIACGEAPGGGLAIVDAYGYAPLVRGGPAVAYLTIRNSGDADVDLHSFTSPLFGRVELHETTLENGVSRMRRVARVRVPARGRAVLEPGGLHLMLLEARAEIAAGTRCPLSAARSDTGRIDFDVVLAARATAQGSGGGP